MKIMLRHIDERKALLRTIIPKLHICRVAGSKARIGGLNWAEYFATNPEDAQSLGYFSDKKKWNANNVVAKYLMRTEGVRPGSNGYTPPPSLTGTLLEDVNERKQLLMEIYPQLTVTPNGQKSWMGWFATHPEHSKALGYDQLRTRPKIWAANLRITQQERFQRESLVPQTPLVSTPDSIAEGIKVLEQKADIIAEMQRKAEVKELREKLRECEQRIELLKAEKTEAALIIFDLNVQLRRGSK